MQERKVVSREEWLIARREHLAREKEFTRLRDQLIRERRELAWVRVEEAMGISIFCKNRQGEVFHTCSCYARGLDMLNTAYHYMDLTPRGRDEDSLPFSMAWLHRHDQYDD